MSNLEEEIKLFVTEFKHVPDDNILEVLEGRLHMAVKDQLEYATRGADITIGEAAKLILKNINDYIGFNWQKKDSSNIHQINEFLTKGEALKREKNSEMSNLEEEIKLFVTEFKHVSDDNIVEVLEGRLHMAVKNLLEYMARTGDRTIGEAAKLLLKDVSDYVESQWQNRDE